MSKAKGRPKPWKRKYTKTHKWCNRCQAWKPHQEFHKSKSKLSCGLQAFCKLCSSPQQAAYDLKRRYGISPAERQLLYDAQRGRCAICGTMKRLVVDHDHRTRKVRGLLCNLCNVMLGSSRDDIGILRTAIKYLRSFDDCKIRKFVVRQVRVENQGRPSEESGRTVSQQGSGGEEITPSGSI